MVWEFIVPAAAQVVGKVLDSSAQKKANKANIKLARETRDWEERMSSTAYQRATADMLAAGLNPMLAYSQGPASSPNANAPTVQPASIGPGIASAAQAAANVQLTQQQARNTAAQAENQAMQNQVFASKNLIEGQGPTAWQAELEKLRAEALTANEQARLRKTDADIRDIERQILQESGSSIIKSAKNAAELSDREVNIADIRTILMNLEIPEKEALAKWFDTVGAASPAAKATMAIGQWLRLIFAK